MTDNLPAKLREQAAIRKKLGAHPCGYQYLLDAADELEALRAWKRDVYKRVARYEPKPQDLHPDDFSLGA